MDIQQYIAADKELLLNLNGSQSLFWDGFMWVATSTIVWVPVAAMLLYIIIKNNKIQEALLTIVMIALVITLADQIASGLCKPFFARFRPTQDPNIMYMVDIVNGYRGGRFGFISSHAANTFAISVFLSLLIKRKSLTFMLLFWAVLNSYSRIYLGAESRSYPQFGLVVSWRRQGLRLFVILGYPLGLRSDPVELRGLEKCFWLERECGVFVWGIGEA